MKGLLDQLVALCLAAAALLVMVSITAALLTEVTSLLAYLIALAVLAIIARIVWAGTHGW